MGVRGPDTEALLFLTRGDERPEVLEPDTVPRWLAGSEATVYVRTETSLVAVSLTDGAAVWRMSGFSRGGVAGPPLVNPEIVVVGGDTSEVVAVDRTDGAIRWRQQTDGDAVFSPVSVRERLYVTDTSRTLYALTADDGSVVGRWRLRPSADRPGVAAGIHDGSPVVAGETVVALTPAGGLVAVGHEDPDTTPRQLVDLDERVAAPPAVVDGAAFVTAPPHVYGFTRE